MEDCILQWPLQSSRKVAFDLGRCPHRAILQHSAFISHGHLDHIGGLPAYAATRRAVWQASQTQPFARHPAAQCVIESQAPGPHSESIVVQADVWHGTAAGVLARSAGVARAAAAGSSGGRQRRRDSALPA